MFCFFVLCFVQNNRRNPKISHVVVLILILELLTCARAQPNAIEVDFLELLYSNTGGDNWNAADDWNNGAVSACDWGGVDCSVDGGTITHL